MPRFYGVLEFGIDRFVQDSDVTGLDKGLVRKLEENSPVPSPTRRRIEAAIEKSIEQNRRLDLGSTASSSHLTEENEWETDMAEDVFFLRAASRTNASGDVYFTKKRGGDEVQERHITQEEWPEWIKADTPEWDGVKSTGGVRILNLEESRKVRAALKRQGKE